MGRAPTTTGSGGLHDSHHGDSHHDDGRHDNGRHGAQKYGTGPASASTYCGRTGPLNDGTVGRVKDSLLPGNGSNDYCGF